MQSPPSPLKTKAIRAGAGAGKTYNLTREVITQALHFRETQQRWPRFVVTTFTKKATQELSERLMALCLQEFPEAMDFVSSTTNLKVSTIHGVLDECLKELGPLIGLKSDFSYFNESEALFVSKKVLKNLIEESAEDTRELLQVFSFSQLHDLLRQAAKNDLGDYQPLSLAHNLELLEAKLHDLRKKTQKLLASISNYQLPEKWNTLQSLLNTIESSMEVKKWSHPELALQAIDQIDLRSGLKLKSHPDSAVAYESLKPLVDELRTLEQSAFQVDTMENLARYNQQFSILHKKYQAAFDDHKKAISRIEINDLEILTLQLRKNYLRQLSTWSTKKDYWFIDEFQDTSPQQMSILKELIGAQPYYLVGDPQQSIYLFRGARSEVFLEQFKKVEISSGELQFLDSNYRSTPSLLAFINTWVEHQGTDFAKMKPARVQEVTTEPDVVLFIVEKSEADAETATNPELLFIKESIEALQNKGITLEKMAILVRRNRDLEMVGQYLSQHKIPVHLHSSGLFWQRREVLAAISLLKFLVHPHDNENLITLLRVPVLTVTDQDLVDLVTGEGKTLWEKFQKATDSGAYHRTGLILKELRQVKNTQGLVHAFEKALKELNFIDYHLHLDPTGRSEGNLWKFVSLLKDFERERGASFVQFINDCEKAILYESSVDSPGSIENNKVNVMTVHASKGLQFDYVFLPFLALKPYRENQQTFSRDEKNKRWSVRAPANESEVKSSASLFEKAVLHELHQRQDQEDLRVLYVAITRAVRRLYLSWVSPQAEQSWSQTFEFIKDVENDQTHSFRIERVQSLSADLQLLSKVQDVPTAIRSPYQIISQEDLKVQLQAVTKIVAKNQKSYREAYIKKQQGILFHKLLEVIKYPVPKDIPALLSSWFGDGQEEALKALNYILTLSHPPVVDLIKNGKVEWAFRWKQQDRAIDGQVDLWAIYQDTLWIVDYKSGEKILLDKSFAQLAVYAGALQEHLRWKGAVQTAVIYPFLETTFVRTLTSV